MNIVFGPVLSRRFGKSLGVDLSPHTKQCNFDCVYCELKGSKPVPSMSEVVSVDSVILAVKNAIKQESFDILTITANGEPTLYPHLENLILELKKITNKKILLLSNGSTLWQERVARAARHFDIVKFSLDGLFDKEFKKVDRAHKSLNLEIIKKGIYDFSHSFSGELIAEVLFVKGLNDSDSHAKNLAAFFKTLKLFRIDISTIDRPPAYQAKPISQERLEQLAGHFKGLNINVPKRKSVESKQKDYDVKQLLDLLQRRPLSIKDSKMLLSQKAQDRLDSLILSEKVEKIKLNDEEFYRISHVE